MLYLLFVYLIVCLFIYLIVYLFMFEFNIHTATK